ncbi:Shikimate Kinase [Blattabacterium sp. (Nauphoeta cinerea)]|uniref:shikimate kinase n=1 Tax=Blattabacterium sp. (Nauphoeta cinerea) TaxID=1316444 RepID=UPI0003B1047B|nr:shikimate kinase [Blattabacterium sp. (Nauphoeta cinerea)]AGW86183.1 Shikimate Kinase [Blattabacterium sp. (Nauphoeta cinerea)]
MKISLIGYMGSGKTTVGKILAEKLNFNFYDLDTLLVENENDSIHDIFKKKGELSFRKKEHSMLNKILKQKKNMFYQLEEGLLVFIIIFICNKYSNTFYLKTDSYTLFKRLFLEKTTRPLISHLSKNELFIFIMKHLSKRIYFYEKSLKKIDISKKTQHEIVQEIVKFVS